MILLWNSKDVAYLGYWFAIWKQRAEFNVTLWPPITKLSSITTSVLFFIVGWFFDLMEKKMGTYAAVKQKDLQKMRKKEKMQTPQATLVPRFLFEFTWISFELHIIWANIDKRFNTNYVSILFFSWLGRVRMSETYQDQGRMLALDNTR